MAWLAKHRGQTALFRNGGEKRCLSPGFAELGSPPLGLCNVLSLAASEQVVEAGENK